MRIKLKNKAVLGDTRTKVKFLFLPLMIDREIRWFEFARIKYEYREETVSYDMGSSVINTWVAVEFLPYDPVKDCDIYLNEGCVHVDGMICDIDECNKSKK